MLLARFGDLSPLKRVTLQTGIADVAPPLARLPRDRRVVHRRRVWRSSPRRSIRGQVTDMDLIAFVRVRSSPNRHNRFVRANKTGRREDGKAIRFRLPVFPSWSCFCSSRVGRRLRGRKDSDGDRHAVDAAIDAPPLASSPIPTRSRGRAARLSCQARVRVRSRAPRLGDRKAACEVPI
jgi:hypothetical protein